ncbi:MAG: hypothetical protein ABIJ92_03130 [Candidatus Aenigmatarchaeota archaeon]
MKELVAAVIMASLLAVNAQALCTDNIYVVDLIFDNGNVSVKNIDYMTGCYPSMESDGYRYDILSDSGRKVYSFEFGNPGLVYTDNSVSGMSGGPVETGYSELTLLVPDVEYAEEVVVYDNEGEKVANIALVDFQVPVFSPDQRITLLVNPTEDGFYKEVYIYHGNEYKDKITLECSYMCYGDKTTSYTIPNWEDGDYSLRIYDYNRNVWTKNTFRVDVSSSSHVMEINL